MTGLRTWNVVMSPLLCTFATCALPCTIPMRTHGSVMMSCIHQLHCGSSMRRLQCSRIAVRISGPCWRTCEQPCSHVSSTPTPEPISSCAVCEVSWLCTLHAVRKLRQAPIDRVYSKRLRNASARRN
jgi:hypothetical protein